MSEKQFIASKNKLPIGPIIFLLIVVLSTLGLFLYNTHLNNETSKILIEKNEITSSIKELSKNEELQIFALLEDNGSSIDILTKRSDVTKYIQHLKAIWQKYDVKFSGFNIASGVIKTNALIESSVEKWIAYTKTKNFIKNYRNEPNGLFDLDFINSIEWMDSMKFAVSFDIK